MILVLNAGSSTVKYRLVDPADPDAGQRGLIEETGETAWTRILAEVDLSAVRAVGHRVVHGGARFTQPTLVTDEVLDALRALIPLAPLHNPGAIAGIEAGRRARPDLPHVAVFDTAFHASLPPAAYTYAIDASVAREHGIRRYGFHGISHRYVSERTAALLGRPIEELNIIVLHLGNGASAAAVQGGRSIDTSMGFTPLEGLVMGTRSGDIDPAIPGFLQREAGLSEREVDDLLQRRSGLRGLCGESDMRAVLGRDDEAARLAVDVYCHAIRRYVGAFHADLGRLDAITFTAGVGEHAAPIRAKALAGLEHWGITVDPTRNAAGTGLISPPGAPVAVCVVPTDEERAIAVATADLIAGRPPADGQRRPPTE